MEGSGGGLSAEARVKEEPEGTPDHMHIKEETEEVACCDDSLAPKGCVGCGVSEEAKLAGLYTDHEVKNELVLGPEHTHRPDLDLVVLSWAIADEDGSFLSVQEPHRPEHALWDCCVRLERVPHVEALVQQQTNTQEDTNNDTDTDSDAEDDIHTKIECEKTLCALCGLSFSLKSDLLEHIMIHIYKPSTEQEESVYGASDYGIADAGGSRHEPAPKRAHALLDCFVKLERLPHFEALIANDKHTTKQDVITSTYADSESVTEEDSYARVDLDNELMCDICGDSFALKSDLIEHVMIHIHVPVTSIILHQSRDTSDAQGQKSDNTQHKSHTVIIHNNKEKQPSNMFVCDICAKTYQQKYELIRHIHYKHMRDPKLLRRRKSGKETYSCYICGKHYTCKSYLKVHYRTHTGERPYECDICQKRFPSSGNLYSHKLIHNNFKLYSCDVCQKGYNNSAHLKIHKRLHTVATVETFECKTCSRIFGKRHHLISHEIVHSGEKSYDCKLCDKRFRHRNSLKYHKHAVHTGEKPYQCKLCGKKFASSSYLATHKLRIHTEEKPYQCEICDKRFKIRKDLNSHILVHTGIKPYSCNICHKKFAQSRTLRAHKLTHTGISCEICTEHFTSLKQFKLHKRFHTGGIILTCGVCDKKFIDSYTFKVHQRTHTNERPFSCSQCDKRFSRKCHLKRHIQEHLGNRPFACKECGKRFQDKYALTLHERTHTGEKPYSCNFCKKIFSRRNNLTAHKRIHRNQAL